MWSRWGYLRGRQCCRREVWNRKAVVGLGPLLARELACMEDAKAGRTEFHAICAMRPAQRGRRLPSNDRPQPDLGADGRRERAARDSAVRDRIHRLSGHEPRWGSVPPEYRPGRHRTRLPGRPPDRDPGRRAPERPRDRPLPLVPGQPVDDPQGGRGRGRAGIDGRRHRRGRRLRPRVGGPGAHCDRRAQHQPRPGRQRRPPSTPRPPSWWRSAAGCSPSSSSVSRR